MVFPVSYSEIAKGIFAPMSVDAAIDPFVIKQLSKLSPIRLVWTLQNRWLESRARSEASVPLSLDRRAIVHFRDDRGDCQIDTAVTQAQLDLLLAAQREACRVNTDIAEIGSYRGATTVEFSANTSGTVYAIDPFAGYGGSEQDHTVFKTRTSGAVNITHIRATSGTAAVDIADASIGMVFIDGVHDFSNSWFDFCAWSAKISPSGMIAFHDVDDHPGVRLAVRNLIDMKNGYTIWAYCPNLIVFKKPG